MDWKNPDIAKRYKPGEAITAPFALHLIKQSGIDRADGSKKLVVLDSACGTGIVTVKLYETLSPAARENPEVVCGDFSSAMVESVQARIEQSGWKGATAKLVDAQNMDVLPSNHFTHVFTSFALVGLPRRSACLAETLRVLQPGGTAGFTSWKSVGWFPIAREAVASIPGAPSVPAWADFTKGSIEAPDDSQWLEPTFFEEEFRKIGYEDVKSVLNTEVTRSKDAEEWIKIFGGLTKNGLLNALNNAEGKEN